MDTIAAIATGAARSAIGILRLSGEDAFDAAGLLPAPGPGLRYAPRPGGPGH